MKRINLLLVFLLTSTFFTISAQGSGITFDKRVDDFRVIEATGVRPPYKPTERKILSAIGLQCWISQQDTTYTIVTNVSSLKDLGAFDDAMMLMKNYEDEIIELYSITSESTVGKIQYANPTVTTTTWKNRITAVYNDNSVAVRRNVNYWLVTEADLEKIYKGIKKIKIQYLRDNYEKEWNKDNKIGPWLHQNYIDINKHLGLISESDSVVSQRRDSFREGF